MGAMSEELPKCDTPFSVLVGNLLASSPEPKLVKSIVNPHPRGVVVAGSWTAAVLEFLRANQGFRTRAQIRWRLGGSSGQLSWALLYLQQQGLVVTTSDARNARYRRYRALTLEEIANGKRQKRSR